MAAKRKSDPESDLIQPVKASKATQVSRISHSQSGRPKSQSDLFPAKAPFPVGLSIHLETSVEGGTMAGREQLNQDTLLIRPQDPNFACCWFSRPLEMTGADGDSVFWMLQKTARYTWLLCLRRGSVVVAAYHLNSRKRAFPITLKQGRVSSEFAHWPRTITVSWA